MPKDRPNWDKIKRCATQVQLKGKSKPSSFAICTASINKTRKAKKKK